MGRCMRGAPSSKSLMRHLPLEALPLGQFASLLVSCSVPCDSNHKEGPWEDNEENDPFVDDPNDLLDEEIAFKVKISNIVFDMGQVWGSMGYGDMGCSWGGMPCQLCFVLESPYARWPVASHHRLFLTGTGALQVSSHVCSLPHRPHRP